MAGSSVVGALRVTLGLDSAQFTTGMKTAQTGLQKFAGIAKTGALAIAGAMAVAGGAIATAMAGIVNRMGDMYDLSQSLGVTVEDLSRLQYAAELSGVELEGLEKAIKKLSVSLFEASQSATGPAASAFRMLGISAVDATGNVRPTIDVMGDLAERFSKLPAGAEKTALAMRIFGRSGADLIPMLNEGRDGLQELYTEAEKLGVVFDTETARAAEALGDDLAKLGKVQDGIVTRIVVGMMPSLRSMSAALVAAAKDGRTMTVIGEALGWTLKALATAAVVVGVAFIAVANDIATAAKTAYYWVRQDYGSAMATSIAGFGRTQRMLSGAEDFIGNLWTPVPGPPPAVTAAVEGLVDLDSAARGARGSVERLTDAQRESAQAAAELARDAAQVYEQTRTPAEQYRAEVERLTRMLNAAAISQDTFNRAMREAGINRDANDPLSQAGARIAEQNREEADKRREDAIEFAADHEQNLRDATYDGIRGGLEAAADGNLGQYLAAKLREHLFDGLATALTNMMRGAQGTSGGGAMGWLNAAGSMFKQFAGGLPGFKTGGSFKVGGSGGADSQLMQFRATPGEMVDIRRPGQDKGGGATVVHVNPSPYFDVQVESVATPIAGRSSVQAFGAARSQIPADDARRRRFSLTGA